MESALVIKVKYGQALRRFNAYLLPGMEEFELDIDGLREKICSLFNFPSNVDLEMTYVDEDGDEVSLVDDDDLSDAIRQRLKCLRIDVRLNDEKQSGGNSNPIRPPPTDNCVLLAWLLKPLPEPVREEFSKRYNDIFSEVPLSNPFMAAILKSIVLQVDSYQNSDSQPRTGADSSAQNVPLDLNLLPTGSTLNLEPSAYHETTPCFLSGIHGSDAEQEHPNLWRPISQSHIYPAERSFQNLVLREGFRCDVRGVDSGTGLCFMSKTDDFGPCSMCFEDTENSADFRGLDHQLPLKAIRPALDSRYILDVNSLDGTLMAPGTPLTKIWRMRNSGAVDWPEGTKLLRIGGYNFDCPPSVKIESLAGCIPVDEDVDIAVDFVAPECPGLYFSFWRMATPSGQMFGQCVRILIQVEAFLGRNLSASLRDLNLNLPPKYEMCFPVDEALLVGQSFPSPTIPTAPVSSSAVSYPTDMDIVELERSLLEDLKRVELKQADLMHREVLKMIESVNDDLCGVSDWDPILEELEEMGFSD